VTPVAYSLFDDMAHSEAWGRMAFWRRRPAVAHGAE
jgi:spore coat protein U-like protein